MKISKGIDWLSLSGRTRHTHEIKFGSEISAMVRMLDGEWKEKEPDNKELEQIFASMMKIGITEFIKADFYTQNGNWIIKPT
jgi:predicted oxidoreductase